jgi:hypothetical protein
MEELINLLNAIPEPSTNTFEKQQGVKRPANDQSDAPTPKRKILSINDMLSNHPRQSPAPNDQSSKPSTTNPPIETSAPPMNFGPFPPPGFPFPFVHPPNLAWTPQMMAMLVASQQNPAARSPAAFAMNPQFMQVTLFHQLDNKTL